MAEQYSWLDASGKGYSAGQHGGEAGKLMEWSRNTVADGRWLNRETIKPFSGRDQYLLASLNQTYDECSAFSGNLQYQINVIEARADVVDVVGSYSAFVDKYSANFDPTSVSDQDVVKILNDETSANAQTYYRWLSADNPTGTWTGVGSLEPYYSNAELVPNEFGLENTDNTRNYRIIADNNRYIQLVPNGHTGTIGLTDNFIESASQCYTALTSNSASWNKTSATLRDNSGKWEQSYTALTNTSGGWNKTSAWVYNNSANIIDASATLRDNSGKWEQSYTALTNTSGGWNKTSATLRDNSGKWEQAYDWSKDSSANLISVSSTFVAYSGKWNDASATLYNNSGKWEQSYTALTNTSGGWNKTSAWVYNNSANIVDASATLYNNSANWQATYSAVSSNSAIWSETAYVPLSAIECKIGSANSTNKISFAQGSANSANEISFAQGSGSSAETISFAQGLGSVAQQYSFAQGLSNSSTMCSFTQGKSNLADYHSIAQGVNSTALNYSQAFGAGSVITNTGMAIGSYNKTSANVAFVIGDGTNDTNRSDLYWIDHNGNVSAKGNITATNFYINGMLLNCTHTYTSGINANQDSYDIVRMNINDISAVQTEQQMQRTVQTLCLAVSANNTNKRYALWPEEYSTNTAASHSNMYIPVFDVKTTDVKKTYIKTSDLNLGNYVSAATIEGVQQKITIATAHEVDDFTQEGIIYLVF